MPRFSEPVRTSGAPSGNITKSPEPGPAPAPADLLAALATIPEEDVWLQKQKSERTRVAYRSDVADFINTVGIKTPDDFRRVELPAVIAWQRSMERAGYKPKTIRRRLSALSSLFTHLAQKGLVEGNPVREAPRPNVNRKQGTTAAFSTREARAILDAPDPGTLQGLRDRAILAVGLQVGCRRSEIAHLTVASFHVNTGYPSLRFVRKGGQELSVAIHPNVAQRIGDYLAASGHAEEVEAPLFLPCRHNEHGQERIRHFHPDIIDRIVKKYVRQALGTGRGYSAHSMRATFITTALENGASLEDVQRDVGHADPTTTSLYDRRGHNPEKSASFFANY
jgi:integrase/recombinase XerD